MHSAGGGVNGEAYVDVRVCDLQIQYGNMPSGLDSGFHVDGLYIVLRCGDEVRRTHCLWPSSSVASFPSKEQPINTATAEENENDWVWNELFRFTLPRTLQQSTALVPQPQGQRMATAGSGLNGATSSTALTSPGNSALVASPRDSVSSAVLPMSTAAAPSASGNTVSGGGSGAASSLAYYSSTTGAQTTPPLSGGQPPSPSPSNSSPFLHPAIDLELWRSTQSAENCLGRYTYHIPLELLHGGYGLQQLDLIAERVIPLRTKEAPSIMGNLYGWSGHRLSLRLRVQAVGLTLVAADWTLPAGTGDDASAAVAAGAGSYALPYSLAVGDTSNRTAMYTSNDYTSSMESLNPVLANLLAPLGVSGMPGQRSGVRPVPGVSGIGGGSTGGLPPVFPLFASSFSEMGRGQGAVLPTPPAPSALATSDGRGILGDGNPAWETAVLPAVFPNYSAPSQQQQK